MSPELLSTIFNHLITYTLTSIPTSLLVRSPIAIYFFLRSTFLGYYMLEWAHWAYVFVCLDYFTPKNVLRIHPWCIFSRLWLNGILLQRWTTVFYSAWIVSTSSLWSTVLRRTCSTDISPRCWLHCLGYISRRGCCRLYGCSISLLRRNFHVFHNGFTNLYFYQQYRRSSFSPHPHQCLLCLFLIAIPIGMK